ncbi:MAG: FRG domain-containing protein [Coriobacteriia bacterium]|nr:FRG domain-containing protein [Coriobacteriia bacterium]
MAIIVESLSDYIRKIEKYDLYECIYRGEKSEHKSSGILSTILRDNKMFSYKNILSDFYFEMEPTLKPLSKIHFIAYARHHSIPTNLIDFSFSPLIALYFACNDNVNSNGQVHFIKNYRLVPINDLIIDNELGWTGMPNLINCDVDLINNLSSKISSINFSLELQNFLYESLIKILCELQKCAKAAKEYNAYNKLDEIIHKLKVVTSSKNGEQNYHIFKKLYNFLTSPQSLFTPYTKNKLDEHNPIIDNTKQILINNDFLFGNGLSKCILITYSRIANYYRLPYKKSPINVNFPFIFTYTTPCIHERIRNQQGTFVFQMYDVLLSYQHIKPDQTFIINKEHKERIKTELEHLGFNDKFIYCDNDHIAQYIIEKNDQSYNKAKRKDLIKLAEQSKTIDIDF